MTTPTLEIFYKLASDTSRRFSVEAFSFTHQHGLNVYFDDYGNFKEICADVELEFWLIRDSISNAEIDVNSYPGLEKLTQFLTDLDGDNYDKVEDYGLLVSGGYTTWDSVVDFYEERYRVEYVNDDDFGRYLCDDLGMLEIPDELQGYFDYEAYGRDTLQNSYFVCNKKVYANY